MGCASPLVERDGVMVCENSESYLVDGCSPTIDTSTTNWASQLVTVKKTIANNVITTDHVVLTFVFNTAVFPTSIEMDMFLCPEWNFGALRIYIYANQSRSLVLNSFDTTYYILTKEMSRHSSSCDSLTTVRISLRNRDRGYTYHSWHIIMEFKKYSDITWAGVGEIWFLDSSITRTGKCMYTDAYMAT